MKIFASLVLLAIAFVFFSCSKNDTVTTDYFINSTNNGINITNTYNASASLANANGTLNSGILLANGDSTSITINVKSGNTLNTTTTYSDASASDNASLMYTIKGHQQTSLYVAPGSLKVNFTNISGSLIEGTFSGNVANKNHDSTTSIINGKFLLPL